MTGLQRILRMYGRMEVSSDGAGKPVYWLWDSENECPVTEADMPVGSERRINSDMTLARIMKAR